MTHPHSVRSRRRSEAEWQQILAAYAESGLGQEHKGSGPELREHKGSGPELREHKGSGPELRVNRHRTS